MQELKGMPAVKSLIKQFEIEMDSLQEKGIVPKLTVIRVGEHEDDIAYEKGIIKRFAAVNAIVDILTLPESVSQETLESNIHMLNQDKDVHGILLFRPLPKHLSEEKLKVIIDDKKDVDCMSMTNMAYLFAGNKNGYPPCTAQAVIELLEHYQIPVSGKNVTIVGRSLVVGKPLAMLLLDKDATVTICHTKTQNLAAECRKADILVACAGVAKIITADYVHADQIVIDVGITIIDGSICGDVDYDSVSGIVRAITPVPGGVGTVTTSVLLKHTIASAQNWLKS